MPNRAVKGGKVLNQTLCLGSGTPQDIECQPGGSFPAYTWKPGEIINEPHTGGRNNLHLTLEKTWNSHAAGQLAEF